MAKRCSRCGARGGTVAVGLSATFVYLDLCELHIGELLHGARRIEPPERTELGASITDGGGPVDDPERPVLEMSRVRYCAIPDSFPEGDRSGNPHPGGA
jgi:hypothetical protein